MTFHVILLLAYMALCRIKAVEQLQYESPGELGKLMGLDWIPHTAVWDWGDGNTTPRTVAESNGSGSVTDSHSEFQFKAADFNFHSDTFQWLVVAGPQAKFKGEGSINGAGDCGWNVDSTGAPASNGGGMDLLAALTHDCGFAGVTTGDYQATGR